MSAIPRTLYVGGRFDDASGKHSKIADEAYRALKLETANYVNGGNFQDLVKLVDDIKEYSIIYWFPDVDNDKEKIVRKIKENNQASLLITSKRNVEKSYGFHDLLYHALGNKSNLFVEITKPAERYRGRVIDPLGNVFLDYDESFGIVGKVLRKRVDELSGFTRINSKKAGDSLEIPDENEFFGVVKGYASVFHDLVHPHPEAANRFLGNASFRCEEGFPSFRDGTTIFVSRRNVDKRGISKESFVPVELEHVEKGRPIKYFGNDKPSVDTPIQVELYNYYPNVKYMLHSHTYIEGAPFTPRIIPCGALEESDEVFALFPDRTAANFCVNLNGHGSVALMDDVANLKGLKHVPRIVPEIHADYAREFY